MPADEPIFAIARHRIGRDGDGVTTLVCFPSCPLHCKYCLNPQCFKDEGTYPRYTPESLYEKVKVDDLYFQATGGGITFGGGEPGLRSSFIAEFRSVCPQNWTINLETSLNIDEASLDILERCTNQFIIDIKDMSPDIYKAYTGKDNARVKRNLEWLSKAGRASDCTIRVPIIPSYNSAECVDDSISQLKAMGFGNFDKFVYVTDRSKK